MKYLKQSFKYFLDKGPYLVLIAIVPSLLAPFLLSPSVSLYYLINFNDIAYESFGHMYIQMHFLPYDFFYLGIVGLILSIFSAAILFGVIDRHMRVGEFSVSFSRAKNRLNYNIITAFKLIILIGLSFELFNLMTAVFYYLWAVLFGPGVKWLVFSTVTFLVMSLVLLLWMSLTILWAPFMLHTGMKTGEAFKTAVRQIAKHVGKVALSLIIVALPFLVVMLLTGLFNCGTVVKTILDGLYLAVIVPFYFVLMYTIFYDVTGIERMDLNKVNIWSSKKK